ncbi:hypothetical protein Pla100_63140 [Neorhodopirellula pilleata]|uniref:Uncharacterized protein n=1 Tax=Neorhodopirellula pilleata TaxID=2714738 RepID=A0A5C5YRJ7_9BACT|nr:hypothetical protein Pla100_63140 [Neorhodopirellula pilleata]
MGEQIDARRPSMNPTEQESDRARIAIEAHGIRQPNRQSKRVDERRTSRGTESELSTSRNAASRAPVHVIVPRSLTGCEVNIVSLLNAWDQCNEVRENDRDFDSKPCESSSARHRRPKYTNNRENWTDNDCEHADDQAKFQERLPLRRPDNRSRVVSHREASQCDGNEMRVDSNAYNDGYAWTYR